MLLYSPITCIAYQRGFITCCNSGDCNIQILQVGDVNEGGTVGKISSLPHSGYVYNLTVKAYTLINEEDEIVGVGWCGGGGGRRVVIPEQAGVRS